MPSVLHKLDPTETSSGALSSEHKTHPRPPPCNCPISNNKSGGQVSVLHLASFLTRGSELSCPWRSEVAWDLFCQLQVSRGDAGNPWAETLRAAHSGMQGPPGALLLGAAAEMARLPGSRLGRAEKLSPRWSQMVPRCWPPHLPLVSNRS